MLDLIKKTVMAGVGLGAKAMEEVEDLVKDFEKKGKMSEADGKEFLKDLREKIGTAQEKVEAKIEKAGTEFFKKVNVVTSDDLGGLKKEIRELKKIHIATADELSELKKEIQALKDAVKS
jgi:polyhydroxyalkanoate synthesis regulator phasin